jgi:hypothetical protein
MLLVTGHSKSKSSHLREAVEALGGKPDSAFMFAWASQLDDFSGSLCDMQNALVGVTGYSSEELQYIEVQPKTLKRMGWDIQGTKWQDSAVFVFVKA